MSGNAEGQVARRIWLGLPAYNEEPSIAPLFQRIDAVKGSIQSLHVVVYDDGSTDGTQAELSHWFGSLDLQVITGERNMGLGEALRRLVLEFVNHASEHDVLVLMDCDDTHDPAQIPEMLAALDRLDGRGVVVASRYRQGSTTAGVPLYRQGASYGLLALYRTMYPVKGIRDYSCGYRAYDYSVLKAVAESSDGRVVLENGFACMPELLLRTDSVGARFSEVPMRLRYDRKLSTSKMDVTANSWRLLSNLRVWRRTLKRGAVPKG